MDGHSWDGYAPSNLILLIVTALACVGPTVAILVSAWPSPRKSDKLRVTHYRAGLRPSESNLQSQFSAETHAAKTGSRTDAGEDGGGKVQSLVVFPVKSCHPVEMAQSRVLPTGLEFDRVFMLAQLRSQFPLPVNQGNTCINDHHWQFVTQRQFPRMAAVKTEIWLPREGRNDVDIKERLPYQLQTFGEHEDDDTEEVKSKGAFLLLRFPWNSEAEDGRWSLRAAALRVATKISRCNVRAEPEMELVLPMAFPGAAERKREGYKFEDVRIWNETVRALNMAPALPGGNELQRYLGVSNRLALFRIDPAGLREVFRCAPSSNEAGYQPVTGFQDAYPLHQINLPSHHEFSARVPKDGVIQKLDILRFRANIITTQAQPYDEETWKQICCRSGSSGLINEARFHVSCRTVRCKLPNVDPYDGTRHPVQPDKSLRSLRAVDEGAPRMGCMGMQLTPLFDVKSGKALQSWIAVGMDIVVEQRGHHVYIPQ